MRLSLLLLLVVIVGCDTRTSQDDYDDFRSRTENYRQPSCEETAEPADPDINLSGTWLIRSRLGAGLALGLRLNFERAGAPETRRYQVQFWLHDQPDDAPALVTTETVVDEDGKFTMIADPLDLGKDVVMSESAVLARVILNAGIIDDNAWCGGVAGQVTSPLNLDLDGSTFYGKRLTPDVEYESLPSGCPASSCDTNELDAGFDQGVADAGVVRPESPNVDVFESARADLTGDWLLNASLAGLPLSLWVSFYDRNPAQAGGLDGAVRLTQDTLDSPPRAQLFAEIDENGRFEIWFPDLALEIESPPLNVEANLLLSGVTQADSWCGLGAGAVSQPFAIDLDGATFHASPWIPGSEVPMDLLNACPVSND